MTNFRHGIIKIKTYIYVFLLISLSLLAYKNMLDNFFIYDDTGWVGNPNAFLQAKKTGVGWHSLSDYLKWTFFNLEGYTYRPIFKTYMLFFAYLFGSNPHPYYFSNLIIHTVNVLLVFILIKNLTKKDYFSFVTAGLFSVFPFYYTEVMHITTSYMLLATLFFLLSLLFFINYITGKRKRFSYIASPFFYTLALFSYEIAVGLVLVLYFFYLLHTERKLRNYILKPLIILAPHIVVLLFNLYLRIFFFSSMVTGYFSFGFHMISNLLKYFIHVVTSPINFWYLKYGPIHLGINSYVYLTSVLQNIPEIASILLILVFILNLFLFIKGTKLVKFFSFWIYIAILPVSTAPSIEANYTYLAFIGGSFLITSFLFWLHKSCKKLFDARIFKILSDLILISFIIGLLFLFMSKTIALEARFSTLAQNEDKRILVQTINSSNISNSVLYFKDCGVHITFVFLDSLLKSEFADLNLTPKCIDYVNNKLYHVPYRWFTNRVSIEEIKPEDMHYFYYNWAGKFIVVENETNNSFLNI